MVGGPVAAPVVNPPQNVPDPHRRADQPDKSDDRHALLSGCGHGEKRLTRELLNRGKSESIILHRQVNMRKARHLRFAAFPPTSAMRAQNRSQ